MVSYRNAKFIEDNGWSSRIDCEINHPKLGWIPYTLDLKDTDNTIDNVSLINSMRQNNDVAAYIPPTEEEILAEQEILVRQQRLYLLQTKVDPIASNNLRWSELTESEQDDIKLYRQGLLDITSQEGFPLSIDWPLVPTILEKIYD